MYGDALELPIKEEDGSGFISSEGVFYESLANWLCTEVLGFCGCGNPEYVALKYVAMQLRKIEARDFGSYEDLPYMFFLYQMDDRELLEHGTTIRCSWLTDRGKQVLQLIEEHCKEDEDSNE